MIHKMIKKWAYILIVAWLLLVMAGCTEFVAVMDDTPIQSIGNQRIAATVTRVVDGDTMKVIINGSTETIRLLLVDTPESVHPDIPEPQPFAIEASDYAKEMLTDQEVEIELDISERDKYDRLLCYLYINGKMFNELLLQEGYARVAYVFPLNVRYVESFKEIQENARAQEKGIWSIENYVKDNGFQQ